jgi:hypothetical protein
MSGAVYQPLPLARRQATMKRQPLLSSCAVAAAMVAVGYGAPAWAQAFQAGTPTVALGSAVRNITSPTSETITIDSATAVLNWTPTDSAVGPGSINYLPTGNVATFANGSSVANFTVLNRILPADPSRAIAFNGTVLGRIGSSAPVPGGNIWFYSPGGIIASAGALFDVGSLILTANDIDTTGGLFGSGGEIRFRGATDSRSAVTIASGATINATSEGSYVALVAPRITQAGTVNVNGSAAYVAAESADITINGGLFDIAVQTGSVVDPGGETTLRHTGTTTGAAPISGTDSQAIYMVAVPKNDAITMLVTGTAGYGAVSAFTGENGAVILSAGYGVSASTAGIGDVSVNIGTAPTVNNASINITGGNFTSRVTGYAVTDALATGGGGTLNFDSAFEFRAGRNASLTANAGEAITVDGSMRMLTFNSDTAGGPAAGQASIRALNGGTITVLGGATADASSTGGGIAGTALFEATNGSTLDFRRESFVYADGTGFLSGSSGQGGTASINISNSTFLVGEQVQVTAIGTGARGIGSGGNGTGGTASITAVNSSIAVSGPLLVSATGNGGAGLTGGTGTGGVAGISLDDSALSVGTLASPQVLQIRATGTGGSGTNGGTGGIGRGGTASLSIFDSTPDASPAATFASNIFITAAGDGANIEFGYGSSSGGTGGAGFGGSASLTLGAGILTTPNISIDASSSGASGNSAAGGPNAGNGGAATSGTATFTVNGGTLTGGNVSIFADADAGSGGGAFDVGYGASGNGGAGGAAIGGTASFVQNGGDVSASFIGIDTGGFGGSGGFSSSAAAGAGGSGLGGGASATLAGGTLTVSNNVTLSSNAFGGRGGQSNTLTTGGVGGTGQGGTASLIAQGSTATMPSLTLLASGEGGVGGFGVSFIEQAAGGAGRGGTAELDLSSGSLTLADLAIGAAGTGGGSLVSATGGEARGGTARATISGGTLDVSNSINLDASASFDGGEGGPGAAIGGTASILIDSGATFAYSGANAISLIADAIATTSFFNGVGGTATGGTASFTVNDATANLAASGTFAFSTLEISASGHGGDGFDLGAAGAGIGGTAELAANGGTITLGGPVNLYARGEGGATADGGDAGLGQGGTVSIFSGGSNDPFVTTPGSISLTSAQLYATGAGGDANEFGYGFSAGGGDGGAGIGGTATFEARNGSITVTSGVGLRAGGLGGQASNGGNGGNGTGGIANVISSADANGAGLIDTPSLFIDITGFGESTFETGYGSPLAGNGGVGTGGTASVLANAGEIAVSSISISAGGEGGQGGGASTGTAGDGGAATGGSITLGTGGGTLTLADVSLFAQADGGFGGFGDNGANSGNGGAATGGNVTIIAGNSALDIGTISTNVDVSANAGGGGSSAAGAGAAGNAGNGGNATGGTLILAAADDAGALTVDPLNLQLTNDSFGGSGGDGGSGTIGGRGGNGGTATGGTIEIATDLGSVTIDGPQGGPVFRVDSRGGDGGFGGDGSNVGDTGGDGGNGGDGMGGTIRVRVNGGAVNLGSTAFYAHGNGGFAGNGGTGSGAPFIPGNPNVIPPIPDIPAVPATPASPGFDGRGRGGTVSIVVADNDSTGEAGSATFGDTLINVAGFFNDGFQDIGGRIEIYDNGSAVPGGIEFASLTAISSGFPETSDQAFDIYSAARRINILGNADIDAGYSYFRANGTGGIDIGGDLNINSGLFVFVRHDNQPATPVDTISAANISSTSLFDFTADPDSCINSAGGIDITSFASGIALNFASAGADINLNAPGDITGGTLSATGSLLVASTSGKVDFDSVTTGQNLLIRAATTAGLGTADVGGFLDIESTGNVTRLDNILAVGDIEIDAGYDLTQPDDSNVVLAPNSSVTVGNITSTAGEIDIEATGSTTGGVFSAGHELSITSLTGGITLDSATAGTLDVPVSAGNSRSVGILAATDVNIGDATAAVDIGLGALSGSVTAGSLNAGANIVLLAGDRVDLGSATANGLFYVANSSMLSALGTNPSNFNAANLFGAVPAPTGGDVTISGAVDAGPVVIASGGLISFGDIASTSFVQLGAATSVTGNDIGAAGSISIDAGGDVTLASAQAGSNIDIFSGGAVDIGSAASFIETGYGSTGGNILIDASSILIGDAHAKGDILLTTAGGSAFLQAPVTGRTITASTLLAERDINVDALDNLSVGSATAGRDLGIVSATLTDVGTASAAQDILIDGQAGVTAGSVTGGRDVEIATSLRGGDTSTAPSRSIDIGSAEAGDDLVVAAFGAVTAGTLKANGTGQDGTVGARAQYADEPGSSIYLISEKGAQIGSIEAAGNVRAINVPEFRNNFQISDGSGGMTINSLVAGGDIDLLSPNSAIAVLNNIAAGGSVSALSTAVSLNALGDLDVGFVEATAGDVALNIGGNLGVALANATGNILVEAAGDVTISDVVSGLNFVGVGSGGEITVTGTGQVRSDGNITIGSVGDTRIQAGGVVGLGAAAASGGQTQVRLGGPSNQVSIDVGQTLFVDGTIRGLAIDLASSNIAIGSAALIGDTDTTSLSLSNNGTSRTFIGGAGDGNGYALSNAEFGRLQAAQIFVVGPPVSGTSGLADVTIQALDLFGSQTTSPPSGRRANLVGSNAGLLIGTNGSVRVEGNVALASAGQNDTLRINASQRIDVITPQASITVKDAQGALAGRLRLSANTVQVSTAQAAQGIASSTSLDQIDERLGTNDGALKPEGYLQANTLEFSIENALYIQNSGGPGLGSTDRAGFTAGSGGVFIDTGDSSSARIAINGRQSDGSSFIGGVDLIPLLSINGQHNPTGGFNLRSTANGCLIVGRSCRFDLIPQVPPVQDVIEKIVDAPDNQENQDGTAVVQALNLPLLQLVDTDGLTFAPLIDEPVTGTGNDDLWLGDDEKDDDGK